MRPPEARERANRNRMVQGHEPKGWCEIDLQIVVEPSRSCGMMKKSPNDDVPGVTQRMSEPRPKAQARIVLPPELAAEDFLASLPDVVADVLRGTCDIVSTKNDPGDPRVATALDGLGEGVAVVVDNGEIVWMNDRLANHSPELLRRFSDVCQEAIGEFMDHPDVRDGESIRIELAEDGRDYEVVCSPMPDDPTRHTIAALISDVTDVRRTEQMVEAIDRAGGELLDLNPDTVNPLDVTARLRLIEDRVVQTMRSLIGFEHFEVRLVDRRTGQLELVIGSGIDPLSIGERIFAREDDANGISGWVATHGRPYLCADVSQDPLYRTGIPNARSTLTVPLRLRDRVVGVLNVESDELDAFDEHDQYFVELYGRYVAMAINILDMLVVERYTTNRNFSSTVLAELREPFDRITRHAAELRANYVGDRVMMSHLDAVLDAVDTARERVLACSTGPRTILGANDDEGPVDDPLVHGRTIVVADDEETIRDAIVGLLERRGATVHAFPDGAGAIETIERLESGIDLIISDVRMPDRNGYEVFRAARKHAPAAGILLMTGFGYDPNHSIVRSSQEGLEAILFKPFRVTQLFEEIHKCLEARSAAGE